MMNCACQVSTVESASASSPQEKQHSSQQLIAIESNSQVAGQPIVEQQKVASVNNSAEICPATEQQDTSIGIAAFPLHPVVGQPITVLVASLAFEQAPAVRMEDAEKQELDVQIRRRNGIPATAIARFEVTTPGEIQVIVGREGQGLACQTIQVHTKPAGTIPPPTTAGVWPVKTQWSLAEEALYSAWVRELFTAEKNEEVAFRRLDEVTADPERNLLFNAMGWHEDEKDSQHRLQLKPDCADTPYFLRAYFAWKRRLPFAFRQCSRGAPGVAPRCGNLLSNLQSQSQAGPQPGELGAVQKFLRRTIAWGVHTGNGRTALDDSRSDLYPVELSRRSIRPGTVYADPYGHILVVVEWMEADQKGPGILYAIDGQPDGSITRKRFWEGNFLWNPNPNLGGSGFKNFRPIQIVDQKLVALSNSEIAADPDFADVWTEHTSLPNIHFYDHMEQLISPEVRDPMKAQKEVIYALYEAAKVRVTSVENGRAYMQKHPGTISMPDGDKIFETTGPWESFATPSRDLRLLIAMDIVENFTDKVRRQPAVFGIPEKDPQSTELNKLLEKLDQERTRQLGADEYRFAYIGSDGRSISLTLKELLARKKRFEIAYNPNDCPELRWGAAPGSAEMATCKGRAPAEQQAKMQRYRVWFAARQRPPRGTSEP